MNSSREDYLKIIYEEGGLKCPVPNKVISDKLKIAPGSVSEMLAKLSEKGLIEYIAYKGSKLTNDGLEVCFGLVRSHRLWEVFLMKHLNYTWREAHEDAHLLEHTASKRMVDRLDEYLGYPHVCPHGEIIPRIGETESDTHSLVVISDLEIGEEATISRIEEEGELLDYAEKIGVKIGSNIRINSKGEYEGMIEFVQDNEIIKISHKAAMKIYVNKDK